MHMIIKAKKEPLITPYFIPNFLISEVTLSYLLISNCSLVKAFTLVIPVNASDTMMLDSEILSCKAFEYPLIFFPYKIATTVNGGIIIMNHLATSHDVK